MKMMDTVTIDRETFGLLFCCSVRYALPRMTYVVSSVTDYIRDHMDTIDDHSLAVIERDIREALAGNTLMSHYAIDRDAWDKAHELIVAEMDKRGVKKW